MVSNRILVVDDEPDLGKILKRILEKNGYEVDVYNDPRIALSNFKPNYYNLLLLDIKMPNLNGFELSRELMKLDNNPKVWFMTAFEIRMEEAKSMFPTLKVDGFIKKPFSTHDLIRYIQTLDRVA